MKTSTSTQRMTLATVFGAIAIAFAAPATALVVNVTDDGETLVNTILGTGITINTPSISYTGGGTGASGTFTDGLASGIGIESGIVLTTGSAADAVGPNDSDGSIADITASVDLGLSGDADLDTLIPGFSTQDAIILEFEFETSGGDLFFNFVFASEEYNEFVGTAFNDVFGFFLDGTNVALLDDGVTPVAINTVNGGADPNVNGDTIPASNSDLYNNNDLSDGGPFFDVQYDGFTDVLQVQALGIGAGSHTIRLAIGDAGDAIFDSAVFIQAGTFSEEPTSTVVPEPATIALLGLGLAGLAHRTRRRD